MSGQMMYVCGYERCWDSDFYSELIYETGIPVWAVPDPEDERVHHAVSHHDEAQIVDVVRLWEAPGGLWFRLEEGGWLSEFWLTEVRCVPDNLIEYRFMGCLTGEY
jgi:hypothetical protein